MSPLEKLVMSSVSRLTKFATALLHTLVLHTAGGTPIEISSEGMSFVVVDQPGNPADMRFGDAGRGAVDYLYSIGKYELTVAQWVEFLNAKATTDDGYNRLETYSNQVVRRGFHGSYRYASQPFLENQPIMRLDWFRAARFANWMHNGKGAGSTETGAYALNGVNVAVTERASGARFWIPTIDEWHKAAYFNGDNTSPQYWNFATQSNDSPVKVVVDVFSDGGAGGSGNYANYASAFIANVGTSGGPSFFGAYDMSGNVRETVGFASGPYNSFGWGFSWQSIGGGIYESDYSLQAGWPGNDTTENVRYSAAGLRLAAVAVPEPSTTVLLCGCAIVAVSIGIRGRRDRDT
jgi:sulfatase modifying factor 1